MSDIQDKMVALQRKIFEEDYYSSRYRFVLRQMKMTAESIDAKQHSDEDLALLCHVFWCSLPDSPAIHCRTFYDLCDIAEHIFN